MRLRHDLTTAAIAILLSTLVLGIGYPLAITGIAQLAFGGKANGSQIAPGGSRLIGAPRMLGKQPDPAYFRPRPSATGYSATATAFSNRGPNAAAARLFYRDALAAYRALEGPYNPGLDNARVPVDAVTTSASGVDPHISPANAAIQARRVAAVRHLPLARVQRLVAGSTDGRVLGVIGEPGVNVQTLNLALDR
jgi:K+-transporting ATPase ATPase C chain